MTSETTLRRLGIKAGAVSQVSDRDPFSRGIISAGGLGDRPPQTAEPALAFSTFVAAAAVALFDRTEAGERQVQRQILTFPQDFVLGPFAQRLLETHRGARAGAEPRFKLGEKLRSCVRKRAAAQRPDAQTPKAILLAPAGGKAKNPSVPAGKVHRSIVGAPSRDVDTAASPMRRRKLAGRVEDQNIARRLESGLQHIPKTKSRPQLRFFPDES